MGAGVSSRGRVTGTRVRRVAGGGTGLSGSDGQFGVGLLHLGDESIDRGKEFLSAGVRRAEEKVLGMRRQTLVVRDARPAADVAVAQQGQSADVISAPRMPKVGEDVFQG